MTKEKDEKKIKKQAKKGTPGGIYIDEIYIPREILVEKMLKAIEQRNLMGWWGIWKKK